VAAATQLRWGDRTVFTPRVRAGWAHEFDNDRQINASLVSLFPGQSFTVNGARPARDSAVLQAGVDVGLWRGVQVFAQFDSELSGRGSAYAGSGGLRISW
jgi:outer membrane autotransporter protein